jgi:hypothetical protein
MKREGVADADIELMLRKNPAKLLGLMVDGALSLGSQRGSRRIAHKRGLDPRFGRGVLLRRGCGVPFRPAALRSFSIWRWLSHMGN